MILVNVIFFLTGATLTGEGIDLLLTGRLRNSLEFISSRGMIDSMVTTHQSITDGILYIILIILGLILIFLGFFGCSGALTQIQCLLYCYSWILGIILVFQTLVIISLVTFRLKLTEQLISVIRSLIYNVYRGPLERSFSPTSVLWDWIMYHLRCCGIESKSDFDLTVKWNRTNPWWNHSMPMENKYFKYPLTCCPINNSFNTDAIVFHNVLSCALNGSGVYDISCSTKIFATLHSLQNTILIIVTVIIFIEMFALTFVLVIINRTRIQRIPSVMERSPPLYSSRTRINQGNLYFRI